MPWRVEEDGAATGESGYWVGRQDVLRSGTQVDEVFNVWSSDPVLVWLVVSRVCCEWVVSTLS